MLGIIVVCDRVVCRARPAGRGAPAAAGAAAGVPAAVPVRRVVEPDDVRRTRRLRHRLLLQQRPERRPGCSRLRRRHRGVGRLAGDPRRRRARRARHRRHPRRPGLRRDHRPRRRLVQLLRAPAGLARGEAGPAGGAGQAPRARLGRTGSTKVEHLHYEQHDDTRDSKHTRGNADKVESVFDGVPSGITSDGSADSGPIRTAGPVSPLDTGPAATARSPDSGHVTPETMSETQPFTG